MEYWWDKDDKEMYKMTNVYDEQVLYLKELLNNRATLLTYNKRIKMSNRVRM